MEQTRVIIQNWPDTSWKDFIPTLIGVISLLVSVISIWYTRREFRQNIRPFVFGASYAVIDQVNHRVIPVPSKFLFRVHNSPAKILLMEVKIKLNFEEIFHYKVENLIRFPTQPQEAEWAFGIGDVEFKEIMNRTDKDKINLSRVVYVKYTSLGGGKKYNFFIEQSFSALENQWHDGKQSAS